MKRRFKANPNLPAKLQCSSVRRFNGVWSSENRFHSTNSRETKDRDKVKKVSFRDTEANHVRDCGPDASTVQYEAAQDTRSAAPKTSEFAFFKKLKKDAGGRNSHPLHKEDNQLNNFVPNDCTREITNMSNHSYGDFRPSVKNVGHGNCDLFLSPSGGASKGSEVAHMVKGNQKGIKSPLPVKEARSINHDSLFSPFHGESKNSGTQCSGEEIFSAKRLKLRQWVADTSCIEVENLSSGGCNLVSMLLSRLFHDGNENNHSRDSKPLRIETDSKHQFLKFPKSEELNWTHRRDYTESEPFPYLDNFSSEYWSNRSRERTLSKWDTLGFDSPSISYPTKPLLHYKNRKPGFDFCGEKTATLVAESDPYLAFPFGNYGSIPPSHLKELDELQDPNESELGREPCARLLGWDFENKKDGLNVCITDHDAVMNLQSTLATFLGDHQQNVEDRFSETELYSSSLFSSYPPNFTSLPHFQALNLPAHDFGKELLKDEKYRVTELNYFPLTLSRTPKCLNLVDNCNTDDAFEDSSSFLSPQNHQRFTANVFAEMQYPRLEALLPSGLGSDLEWKCLSMSESFRESHSSTYHAFESPLKEGTWPYLRSKDEQENCLYTSNNGGTITHFIRETLGSHILSSINFQLLLDKEIARPLQLDYSSWVGSDEDICHDDEEGDPFDASNSLFNGSVSFY